MPRRVQVNPNQPEAVLQPVANPTARPFVPRLGPETILPVREFAGLSNILAKVTFEQAEEDGKVAQQQRYAAAQSAPIDAVQAIADASAGQDGADAAIKENQKRFAEAVKSGDAHVSQNPWANVGWEQGMAARLMHGYDAKLNARLAETTATTDPATGDPIVAKTADEVASEVWKEYAKNPLLSKSYYGSQVALKMKAQADANFASDSSRQLAENKVRDLVTYSTTALSDKLFGLHVAGAEPTPDQFAELSKFTQEVYLKSGGVANVQQMSLQAIKSAGSRIQSADDGKSGTSKEAEFYRSMRDMPVRNTTARKDPAVGPALEDMIAEAERSFKEKSGNALQADRNAQAAAILKAEQEVFTRIDEARKTGAPVDIQALSQQYIQDIRSGSGTTQANQYGNLTGVVVDAVQKLALDSTAQQGQIDGSQLIASLDEGDDPDAVAYTARINRRQLGLAGYRAVMKEVENRKAVRPLIEDSPVSAQWDKKLADASEIPGIPPSQRGEVGLEQQESNRALVDQFNSRRVTAMQEILKLPEEQRDAAQRKWGDENVPALEKELRANSAKFSADKANAVAAIQDKIATRQDPSALISQYRGLLSADEAEGARARGIAGRNMEPLTLTPAFQNGERFYMNAVAKQYDKDPDQDLLTEVARRAGHDFFVARIGDKLAGADPTRVDAIVEQTAREVTDDVLAEVAAKKLKRFSTAAEVGGATVPEEKAAADFAAADLNRAQRASQDPAAAATVLLEAGSPNVSEELLALQKGFLGGERKFTIQSGAGLPFGRVQQSHLLDRAYVETKALLDDPAVDDATKGQAAVDMRLGTVVPAQEVLDGVMTVAGSPNQRQRLADYAQRIAFLPDPFHLGQYKTIKDELDRKPRTVDIKKTNIPPFTTAFFHSDAELKDWSDHREGDLRALAKRVGVEDMNAFINQQRLAIQRANQE